MKKYALIFAASYLALTAILFVLGEVLKVGGAAFNITAIIAASFFAAWRFSRDKERRPNDEEKKSYALLALASAWIASLVMVVVAVPFLITPAEIHKLLAAMTSGIFIATAAVGFVVISAIYYFAIRWAFSWYANRACRA